MRKKQTNILTDIFIYISKIIVFFLIRISIWNTALDPDSQL